MKRKELLFKLSPLIGKKIALYISYDNTDPLFIKLTVIDALILVNFLPYRFTYRFEIL